MSEDRRAWEAYVERISDALGIDPAQVPIDEILDLTRIVAHQGIRPMAPVSVYVLALAVAASPGADRDELRQTLLAAGGFADA